MFSMAELDGAFSLADKSLADVMGILLFSSTVETTDITSGTTKCTTSSTNANLSGNFKTNCLIPTL